MSHKQIQLKLDLKKFGLNPAEWNIKKTRPKQYKIAHTKDNDFYFLGEVEPHTLIPRWAEIRLVSV